MQPSDISRADRFFMGNEAVHTGRLWSMPGRIAACLVCVAALVQALSGPTMWI
jgi:uncharacterized iron-regulated membrane protein